MVCTTGLYLTASSVAEVDTLDVRSCTTGVLTDESAGGGSQNLLIRTVPADGMTTQTGVKATSGVSHSVRSSEIFNFAQYGAWVGQFGLLDLGTSSSHGENWIEPGSGYSPLKYIATKPPRGSGLPVVSAEYNYYGTSSPSSSLFGTYVDYDPFLSEPPGSASQFQLGADVSIEVPGIARAFPNPFTGSIQIEFRPARGVTDSRVAIVDVAGRLVARLGDATPRGDLLLVDWDGRSEQGVSVAPGVYFARIPTSFGVKTLKLQKVR